MAIERLATYHQPEDLPLIARSLGDTRDSVPALLWSREVCIAITPEYLHGLQAEKKQANPLDVTRRWQAYTLNEYAAQALRLLTGKEFTAGILRRLVAAARRRQGLPVVLAGANRA